MQISWFGGLAAAGLAVMTSSAAGQSRPATPLADALVANRTALAIDGRRFTGPGAAVLGKAVAEARHILVGEDHANREVPNFVATLCGTIPPRELGALMLEVGRHGLESITPALRSSRRGAEMTAFNRRYVDAVAFLDHDDDNAAAAACVAGRPDARLVGLDQEFLGSSSLLIERILAERLSPAARKEMLRLQAIDAAANAKAGASGSPGDLWLFSGSDADYQRGIAALASGGTPRARSMFADLKLSHDLYANQTNTSNVIRANLLKQRYAAGAPARGKVVTKIGAYHAIKGYNQLRNRDLGNFVAEIADREGTPSLHLLMLGVRGTRAGYAGYAKPRDQAKFEMAKEDGFGWVATAEKAMVPGPNWTLVDLRQLRHRRIAGIDAEWRQIIDGFDLLVLVPENTPTRRIE